MNGKQLLTFRTHKADEVDQKTVGVYIEQLAGYCDVSVNLNVKDSSAPAEDIIKFWSDFCHGHSIKLTVFRDTEVKSKYPYYNGAWLHSQFSFIATLEDCPDYQTYWFVEYDVRFNGNIRDLLEAHEGVSEDLLGTHVSDFKTNPYWGWWREKEAKLPLPIQSRYKYFGPISRYSNRLLHALRVEAAQYYSNLETFIPTICVCQFGPDSIRNLNAEFWDATSCRYFPVHGTDQFYQTFIVPVPANRGKVFHPVKGVAPLTTAGCATVTSIGEH